MRRLAKFLFGDLPPDVRYRKLKVLLIVIVVWVLVGGALAGLFIVYNSPIRR